MFKFAADAASWLCKRRGRGREPISQIANHYLIDMGFEPHQVAVVSEFIDRCLGDHEDPFGVLTEPPRCRRLANDRSRRRSHDDSNSSPEEFPIESGMQSPAQVPASLARNELSTDIEPTNDAGADHRSTSDRNRLKELVA